MNTPEFQEQEIYVRTAFVVAWLRDLGMWPSDETVMVLTPVGPRETTPK